MDNEEWTMENGTMQEPYERLSVIPYFFLLMKENASFLPVSTVNCIPIMMTENTPSKKEFEIFLLKKTCALCALSEEHWVVSNNLQYF